MNRNDITNILEGSFDAGFLIDGSKGAILFANEAAEELFGLTSGSPGRFSKSIGSVSSFLSFYAYSTLDYTQGRKDILEWSEVLKYVKNDPEGAPDEWVVNATRRDQTTFPGVIRLIVSSSNKVVAYVRHKDMHQATVTPRESSSISAGGDSQSRQRRFADKEVDTSSNAMLTIDEKGNILTVNRAAIDTVKWCRENLVGKHIVEAAGWQSLPPPSNQPGCSPPTLVDVVAEQPSMTVDEDGIVLSINQAATDTISWCQVDLVGHHLPSLGGESTAGGRPGMEEQRSSSNRSRSGHRWSFRHQSSKSTSLSKSSPHVLHVKIQSTKRSDDLDKESRQASDTETILLAIFEASLDPLFQVNEKGTIQMVNSAATKLFGWTREDFLGNNISMICGGAHGSKHNRYMARYLATGDTRVMNTRRELPAKRQDGSEFPIELALMEVDTFLGDERLFCGFVRDLTNVKDEARAQLRKY